MTAFETYFASQAAVGNAMRMAATGLLVGLGCPEDRLGAALDSLGEQFPATTASELVAQVRAAIAEASA